ncbi:gluconate 5-dehydrogenase [Aspergillus bombycis]|uniref:Gluconate 5-dehydrogenase n=1 Tax=Aspergillus bombycis TaxID=109264 RepID=A0A1F7ZYJ0_9EURO|nr:gluconate 5-dehydrogenase [Aspergillus bombycis]OGM44521.1 gluconate 5-dehydrogenase [Aspergillus bombycis]
MAPEKDVVVVTGCGGMGLAIARRVGSGACILLADYSHVTLERAVQALREEGHSAQGVQADVADLSAVNRLASHAARLGSIRVVAHTAGVAMNQAPPSRIYQVNLLGTANVIEAFYPFATAGTSLVAISSAAGHGLQGLLSPDLEQHLATAPLQTLLQHPDFPTDFFGPVTESEDQRSRISAYGISKRGNILRVQASAPSWASKGARTNSVSPGVVQSTMMREELEGPGASPIRKAIDRTAAGRLGTTADIANAVAFLCSKDATFVMGSDLLVDGGLTASNVWGHGDLE